MWWWLLHPWPSRYNPSPPSLILECGTLVVVVVVVEHFEDPRGLSDYFASAGFSTGNKEFPDSSVVSIIRSLRAL
jgi:hypothetical protein